MTTIQKREKLEKQYSYSRINPRPRRTKWKAYEPSMIVPDRNMSISVIMSKYAGGQHRGLDSKFTPPEMMDFVQGIDARKLSICELHQRIDDNRKNIQQMQKNLQHQEQTRLYKEAEIAQKKYRDDLAAEIQKEMKEAPKMH